METENRESFFARLSPFLPPSQLRRVEVAYMMAKYGHRAQTRKELDCDGNPVRYFEHLRRTAILLIDDGVHDTDVIISALLHDSLEDTKDVTEEIIEHLFGPRVCLTVKLVSKVPKEGYLERLRMYGTPEAMMVKIADRLDNLTHMEDCTPEFKAKQFAETKEKMLPLFRSVGIPSAVNGLHYDILRLIQEEEG